jgi:hypothetical protein
MSSGFCMLRGCDEQINMRLNRAEKKDAIKRHGKGGVCKTAAGH